MNKSTRFLSVLLSLCLLLGLLPSVAFAAGGDHPFTDVPNDAWYSDAVQYVYEHDMMVGTSSTAFSPNTSASRGMIVTILYRLEGLPSATGTAFSDVPADKWYTDAVTWASANNIVNGYGNGRFGPDDPITREQMAVILYRYAAYKEYDTDITDSVAGFSDEEQVSSFAVDAVNWAVGAGLLQGVGNNTLSPAGGANRAQAATVLMRFCENIAFHTVTFMYNYGSEGTYNTAKVEHGKTVSSPANPTRSGYAFDGWYTAESGGNKFDFNTTINGNLVLYAHWSLISSGGGYMPPVSAKNYTVTFDSNGGSAVAPQTVQGHTNATQPNDPEKESCIFIGWYCSNGYSRPYDFDTPVEHNLTLYAKWLNENDDKDSDEDGLTDALEKEFGSDPTKADTDDDGVPDYLELDWLNYDPTAADTDQNGISDADEDPDSDGLTNREEAYYGTNPIHSDSDGDYLSDYDELNTYHTDPLNADTDSDGVNDGVETEIGSDPLQIETKFETAVSVGSVDENTPVTVSAKAETNATGAGTLQIKELAPMDNLLLSQNVAGYLGGPAYDFSTDGVLESAVIMFEYDSELWEIGETFQPRIYYLNEETGLLEELPNQTVTDGTVCATVSHFSTYILLNKVDFDSVWEAEIRNPQNQENPQYTGIDIVLVIDSSGSMTSNDKANLRKEAAKDFVAKLGKNDRAAVIDFDSSASVYQQFTSEHDLLNSAIDRVNSSGNTNLSKGISLAISLFTDDSYTRTDAYKYIVFLTDGDGSYNTNYTTTAHDNNIVIYTIGLGRGVRESTLRAIADGTGGKYFFAASADDLPDIYADVSFETIDYTTDTNNDGISDYYTKLLNDGILPLSSACFDLIDVTDMYGEECDDWDGDGLKNGEEIHICVSGNKVYVKMESHPLLADSDGDGYSDAEEKRQGTPPMKRTSDAYSYLKALEDDKRYMYTSVADDKSFVSRFNALFDVEKTDEAKEQLIAFFYDYASADTIEKNSEKIAALEIRNQYLKYMQSIANIAKTTKSIYTITGDVADMVNDISDSGDAKTFIDEARAGNIKIEGASRQLRASRKKILDAMNTNQFFSDEDEGVLEGVLKDVLSDANTTISTIEEFQDLFREHKDDFASFTEDLTTAWDKAFSEIAVAVSTIKTCYDGFRYMRLDTGFKAISRGYKDFLKSKGDKGDMTSTYVDAAMDVVDGVIEITETCNTYGKLKANRDAYVAYIDLLYYIAEHAPEEYDRVAAHDIAKAIEDESWDTYEKQLVAANTKTIALTSLSIVMDIASNICPYTKVAKSVYDIAKLTINVAGLSNQAKLIVSCRTMKALSDGCIEYIDSNIEHGDVFFSYDGTVAEYMTQLAQCRLVGEDYEKKRLLKNDLGKLISSWFLGMGNDEIEDTFKTLSRGIYTRASALGLTLSSKLPYYSVFHDSGRSGNSGGSSGGGSGTW